jgi:hypothetical protein
VISASSDLDGQETDLRRLRMTTIFGRYDVPEELLRGASSKPTIAPASTN